MNKNYLILLLYLFVAYPSCSLVSMEVPLLDNDSISDEENESICLMCRRGALEDSPLLSLTCHNKHVFHADCLKQWFVVEQTCPLCHQTLSEEEKEQFQVSTPAFQLCLRLLDDIEEFFGYGLRIEIEWQLQSLKDPNVALSDIASAALHYYNGEGRTRGRHVLRSIASILERYDYRYVDNFTQISQEIIALFDEEYTLCSEAITQLVALIPLSQLMGFIPQEVTDLRYLTLQEVYQLGSLLFSAFEQNNHMLTLQSIGTNLLNSNNGSVADSIVALNPALQEALPRVLSQTQDLISARLRSEHPFEALNRFMQTKYVVPYLVCFVAGFAVRELLLWAE
jgi:Anaphase-promoting complex subunit 11 RING-H2 finger